MTCNCLKPNQSQKFDKFCWSVKITQNITKHQNMIKIADSVEVFFYISTGMLFSYSFKLNLNCCLLCFIAKTLISFRQSYFLSLQILLSQ